MAENEMPPPAPEAVEAQKRRAEAEKAARNVHMLAQFGVLALSTEKGRDAIKEAQESILKTPRTPETSKERAAQVTESIVALAMHAYDIVAKKVLTDLTAAFKAIPADEVTTKRLADAMVEVCGTDIRKVIFAKDAFMRVAMEVFGPDVMKRLDDKAKEELMAQGEGSPIPDTPEQPPQQ